MTKLTFPLLLALAFSFLLSACTIQKRQHLPGYHFAWNHSSQSHNDVRNQSVQHEADGSMLKPPTLDLDSLSSASVQSFNVLPDSASLSKPAPSSKSTPRPLAKHAMRFAPHPFQARVQPIDPNDPREYHQVREPLATPSLILAIGGWVLSFVSGVVPVVGFLSFFMILAALVTSIIALSKIKKNGGEGHGAALAALILSLVYFLLFIAAIVLILSLI